MSLTLVAVVDALTASVRLTMTGGTPPYAVDASPGGSVPDYRVRSTYSPVTGDPSGRVALDGEAPLNTPVVYVVTDTAGHQAQSAVVTVTSDAPVLSDATDPGRAIRTRVVSQKPNAWEARSVWWDVLGTREPFVSVAPMRLRNGPLVLRTESRGERSALLDLLATGNPLVLRSTCPDAVDDVVLLVESAAEDLVLTDAPAGPTHWTLTYQAVSRDLGPYAVDPGRSYATVAQSVASYDAVFLTYTDYDHLRTGDVGGGLGAELVSDGSFSSGLTGWDVFWTGPGVAWDSNAQTARATNADPAATNASLTQPGVKNRATHAGAAFRVSGRVRSTAPGTVVKVQLLTNKAPASADHFEPGVAAAVVTLTAGAAWRTFAVDVVVPVGHDVATVSWRGENMAQGAVLEWDDLSVRERV